MAEKILIVDDHPEALMLLREILAANGYEVIEAASGPEAIAQLGRELPDVVLLDVMMPEMSGLEVLERIKSDPRTERLPVVLVTAKDSDQDILTGYQYGADYYLRKPFSSRQVIYSIRLALGTADLTEGAEDSDEE